MGEAEVIVNGVLLSFLSEVPQASQNKPYSCLLSVP